MIESAPPRRAWWAPGRHQGLLVAALLAAVVMGLAFGGAFPRTTPASSAPSDVSSGGAIRGVTRDSIKIVLYQPPENDPVSKIVAQFVAPRDTNAEIATTVRGFIKALGANNPALHGRHIDLVVFTGSANLLDSVAARSDAVKIAEDIKPFMVWNGPLLGTAFADELAARRVMCFMCVNAGSNAFFAAHAPYIWSLEATPEQVGTQVAEYVKKRLAGQPAVFAGEASLRKKVRRFGLLSATGPFGLDSVGPSIADQLRRSGVRLADQMEYGDSNAVNQVQATMIGRLKARGVTTVIYAGDPIAMGSFMHEATEQQWFPEWVMTGSYSSERSSWGREDDPRQMKDAFGITQLPVPVSPNTDAVLKLYRKANGVAPPAAQSVQALFAPVYLFFSGLSADRGSLRPQDFRAGLFKARPIGGDPKAPYIPLVSFGRRGYWPYTDYAGTDDFAEIWWNPEARGRDEFGVVGRGLWEFADGGRRYLPGKWPNGPPHAFRAKHAIAVIDE